MGVSVIFPIAGPPGLEAYSFSTPCGYFSSPPIRRGEKISHKVFESRSIPVMYEKKW